MVKSGVFYFGFFAFAFLLQGCEEVVNVPKPRSYPRVLYPEKKFQVFDANYCSFTFNQAQYAKVERDTTFFEQKVDSDCWFNLHVPELSAKIHCSYYAISNRMSFDKLAHDAFEMAQKHNIKATYIEEIPINRLDDKVYGMLFNIQGRTASSYQFYLTDSTKHFLRGALYFNTQAKPDSLEPVVKFMREDLDEMIQTLKWKS